MYDEVLESQLSFPRINKDSRLTQYMLAVYFNPNSNREEIQEAVYGHYKGPGYGIDMLNMLLRASYFHQAKEGRKHIYSITDICKYHLWKLFGDELNNKLFKIKYQITHGR